MWYLGTIQRQGISQSYPVSVIYLIPCLCTVPNTLSLYCTYYPVSVLYLIPCPCTVPNTLSLYCTRYIASVVFIIPCLCAVLNTLSPHSCLQRVVEGCGQEFQPYIDPDLMELIFRALHHTNRFVRETGYHVCGAIVGSAAEQGA